MPAPKRAGKVRRQLDKRIAQGGDAILDEVVVKVNAKHKVQVHDPRRMLAGTLTPVLTWGLFGLLAGGLKSAWRSGRWSAPSAAACTRYYSEHLLTKDELKRIGSRLPADSSAIFAWLRAADPRRILSSAASFQPDDRQRRGGRGGPVGAGLQRRPSGGPAGGQPSRRGAEHARGPVRR